jgi:plastocyanin
MPQSSGHAHHASERQVGGMVMNENRDNLPRDCEAIAGDVAFTVEAGTPFAADIPGAMFGYDQAELRVPPCSRVTVTLENRDEVRHQWMLHGLPRYLYPGGMFHIEANGGTAVSGTFIVPSDDRTYMVHCDLAQHMDKGMKAQLVVGKGNGDLWSVPGISADLEPDAYLAEGAAMWVAAAAVVGWLAARLIVRR